MPDNEKELRKFLNLADDAELSPVSRAIITQYLDLPPADFQNLYHSIPNGIEFIRNQGILPAQQANPLINGLRANPHVQQGLRDQLFLFAAGSQLAFEAMTPEDKAALRNAPDLRTEYESTKSRITAERGLDPLYAHTYPTDEMTPNSVIITLAGAIAYMISYVNGSGPKAVAASRDQYHQQVRLAVHAGAEETLHALQHHDPQKRAALVAEAVQVYGADWQNERERQFLASRPSLETQKAFGAKDPWEKDVDASMAQLEKRVDALQGKFLSPKIAVS